MAGHSHRSSIKNGHKGFKSRHSSKGALKRIYKGKVEKNSKSSNGSSGKPQSKLQRKNAARQLRQQKIMDTGKMRKLFEGSSGADKIITIIPLANDVDPLDIYRKLLASAEVDDVLAESTEGPFVKNLYIKKYKGNLKIVSPDMSNFLQILDCAKVSDYVIFGLSGTSEVDTQVGEQIIRALELQGIASYMGVVSNLSEVHPKEKFQLDVKKSLESYFKHFFPNEDRVYNLEKLSESSNALRVLCQKYPREVKWRDDRGYVVADEIDFVERDLEYGELVVEGTVRGNGFHANRLVHIPELGDFQLTRIEKCKSSARKRKQQHSSNEDLNLDLNHVFESTDNRETLDDYAPTDYDVGECYEDEEFEYDNLKSARYDGHGFLPGVQQSKSASTVPKGTSEYQAKWYLNDVEEVSEGVVDDDFQDLQDLDEDEEIVDSNVDFDSNGGSELMEVEEDMSIDGDQEPMFVDLSPEEEENQLNAYRDLEKEDREFPDEIELKPNESAIERLKRYRGLKNLYNCNWDVDEKDPHAPTEWNRVLRISNYKNTRAKIIKDTKKEAQVSAGDVIRLYIKFPKVLLSKIVDCKRVMFAVYGLLLHEHKNAVVNFSLQRWEEFDQPVPSKEPLIVQYGVRRYKINPIFSAASNSPNNVHKYERFLHPDSISVATCIAPVDFTQSPAIFFKQSPNDPKGIELIGSGTFLNTDYTRILAKRVVLTGFPFRFNKNVLTARYMFFNAEDVEWFKSIPLFTPKGRSGFIKEALGTHGYFKATFDGKLSAEDVVAMSLYKRIWPRASERWVSN